MKTIRIGWSFIVNANGRSHLGSGGQWVPDTPDNRGNLALMVEAGNFAYGPQSHWIEQSDLEGLSEVISQQAATSARMSAEPSAPIA